MWQKEKKETKCYLLNSVLSKAFHLQKHIVLLLKLFNLHVQTVYLFKPLQLYKA